VKEYEIHPLANLLPPMTDEEFKALVEDIKKNGVLEPIVLHEGKILDGRHRYKACKQLGIKIKWISTYGGQNGGDPLAYILSKNLHRRHLTKEQQREVIVGALKAHPEKSDRQQAKALKVSDKTVAKVRKEEEHVRSIPHIKHPKARKTPNKPKLVKLAITNVPVEPKVVQVEITTEQRKAVNAELEHINSGDRKSAGALAEFKVACNTWLPKLNREHLDEAVRYCGTFATAKAEPVS
jgi:hypothetical protein